MSTSVDCADLFNRFGSALNDKNKQELIIVTEIMSLGFQNPSVEDLIWLKNRLKDPNLKWLIAIVSSRISHLSDELFEPLMNAAIAEVNPSANRSFIDPCMSVYGPRRVNEYLLHILETGEPFKQAGAVNAFYWAQISLSFTMKNVNLDSDPESQFSLDNATPESRDNYLALEDVWYKKRLLFLELFVKSENLDVQRSLISSLNLDANSYPDSHKLLIEQAKEIARSHYDEYIRHRVEIQLGNDDLLKALPQREEKTK